MNDTNMVNNIMIKFMYNKIIYNIYVTKLWLTPYITYSINDDNITDIIMKTNNKRNNKCA